TFGIFSKSFGFFLGRLLQIVRNSPVVRPFVGCPARYLEILFTPRAESLWLALLLIVARSLCPHLLAEPVEIFAPSFAPLLLVLAPDVLKFGLEFRYGQIFGFHPHTTPARSLTEGWGSGKVTEVASRLR